VLKRDFLLFIFRSAANKILSVRSCGLLINFGVLDAAAAHTPLNHAITLKAARANSNSPINLRLDIKISPLHTPVGARIE